MDRTSFGDSHELKHTGVRIIFQGDPRKVLIEKSDVKKIHDDNFPRGTTIDNFWKVMNGKIKNFAHYASLGIHSMRNIYIPEYGLDLYANNPNLTRDSTNPKLKYTSDEISGYELASITTQNIPSHNQSLVYNHSNPNLIKKNQWTVNLSNVKEHQETIGHHLGMKIRRDIQVPRNFSDELNKHEISVEKILHEQNRHGTHVTMDTGNMIIRNDIISTTKNEIKFKRNIHFLNEMKIKDHPFDNLVSIDDGDINSKIHDHASGIEHF